jgi:DNA-binding transcriptional regulator YhcF (GntR family)
MLDVNVDRSGPVPLHDQVAAQIRRAIADGEGRNAEEARIRLLRHLTVTLPL